MMPSTIVGIESKIPFFCLIFKIKPCESCCTYMMRKASFVSVLRLQSTGENRYNGYQAAEKGYVYIHQ